MWLARPCLWLLALQVGAAASISPPVDHPSRETPSMTPMIDVLYSIRTLSTCATDRWTAKLWTDAYVRARTLVGEMTLDEKVNVTRGFASETTCAGFTGTVPRLGWPGMCLHDAGNGVRATDLVSAFPSALHVGASWDHQLTYDRAVHMGREFRAKGVNMVLGPSAGPLGRSPLGGRNWESFSVDPWLAGKLTALTVKGLQEGAGVVACVKHLVGNEQETYRRPYFGIEAVSSNIDDRTLHEVYLWPFADAVRAGAASVMCSYQRVNGTYGCDSAHLLNGVLKAELGFEGFVLLDWNAVHRLESAEAGLDMVMPRGGNFGRNLTEGVANGTISEERVTDMATRIIAAWYFVGQDDGFPTPGIGMRNLTEPHEHVDARDPASRPTILQGAVAGHVLVKNVGDALPFAAPPRIISVFGYDATVPPTKNTDKLFELGYMSSQEMGLAELGTQQIFDQAARGGTIVTGGRAGANAPAYMLDPLSSIQHRAARDGSWVSWDLISQAPDINAASDVCLVFINAMATEGWDREGLRDDFSDNLVLNVARRCSNTVVVIHAAGIRIVDRWIEHVNVTAVVIAHLPGQDSGEALVRLLYGEEDFSGRLPYTIARKESDYGDVLLPCGLSSSTPGDTDPQCDFDEGPFLDYRAFDAADITPRFEFGFGLSYTTFTYGDLTLDLHNADALIPDEPCRDADTLWDVVATVTATVRNTGTRRAGSEVAQLYIRIPGGDRSPHRQLRGFDKVKLEPGHEVTVKFDLTRRDLAVWDVHRQAWVVPAGEFGIFVGASSRNLPLETWFVL